MYTRESFTYESFRLYCNECTRGDVLYLSVDANAVCQQWMHTHIHVIPFHTVRYEFKCTGTITTLRVHCSVSATNSVWRTYGEAVDMGREVASWLEQYLGKEGFRLLYMSPRHRGRQLMDDNLWSDVCTEEYEVVLGVVSFRNTVHKLPCGVYTHVYGPKTTKCSGFRLSDAGQFFEFDASPPLQLCQRRASIIDVNPFIFAGEDLERHGSRGIYPWVTQPQVAWDWTEATWTERLLQCSLPLLQGLTLSRLSNGPQLGTARSSRQYFQMSWTFV